MRRGLVTGFIVWALATLVFRFFSPILLSGDPRVFVVVFLAGGVVSAAIALALVRFISEPGKALRFGAGLVIPGLIIDSTVVLSFPMIFPDANPGMAAPFGALMLWGYGIILAAVLLFGERVERRPA